MSTTTADQRIIELEPTRNDETEEARQALAEDVLVGLSETPKRLSSRFFYDARGSQLFQAITDLDEYYPTRVEHSVLSTHAEALLRRFEGDALNIIDLGAGDGRKTRVVLAKALELGIDVRACLVAG